MVRIFILIIGLTSFGNFGLCSDDDEQYDNYTLVELTPRDEEEAKLLGGFSEPTGTVQILKRSYGTNDSLDLLVPPGLDDTVREYALHNGIHLDVKSDNFRRSLDASLHTASRRALRSFGLFSYNSYQSILEFLDTLSAKYPDCVKIDNMGKSYEKRPLRLVKISRNPGARNNIIFVDAGVHAREWVAPAMALYLIKQLSDDCELSAEDPNSMLKDMDWYILPVVNPDGYEYSRTNNRMWRKTRSQYTRRCRGVDGNRNYGLHWGINGARHNPCDPQTYPGPQPFSEVETRVVRDIMISNSGRIKLYVSLHAYGQYLVYPWGYTGDYLPNTWKDLDALARLVSDAVVEEGGRPFRVMSAGQWYAAAGGSDDFAFGVAKIPYSYTMELTEDYQFLFPEQELEETLPTFYPGFKVFHRQIAQKFPK